MDEVLLTKDASRRRPAICRAGDTGFAAMWASPDDFRIFGHRLDSTGVERIAFAWVDDGESGLNGAVRVIKSRVVNAARPLA